jgi:hypothetical protein
MAKDLGILTDVVLLSILARLASSQGIQGVVLKQMICRTSRFTERKVRLNLSALAETPEESRSRTMRNTSFPVSLTGESRVRWPGL